MCIAARNASSVLAPKHRLSLALFSLQLCTFQDPPTSELCRCTNVSSEIHSIFRSQLPDTPYTCNMARRCAEDRDQPRGRRARRAANDTLLASAAPALDQNALCELFSHNSASFWDSWQAFAALPERGQQTLSRNSSVANIVSSSNVCDCDSLRRIDAPIRNLLRQGHVQPVVRHIENEVHKCVLRTSSPRAELELVLPNARDRMVAHGVAQFYGLRHHSLNTTGNRRVIVLASPARRRPRPKQTLIELLV